MRQFEDRLVSHLAQHFPDRFLELKEDGTRDAVRFGVEKAGSYGIESERDVSVYIDIMFEFGKYFDDDFAWAGNILRDPEYDGQPSARMDALYDEALKNLDGAGGIKL